MILDYKAISESHPKLQRGQVWCLKCGVTRKVNSALRLRFGWPTCCGYTMSLDSPEEVRQFRALVAELEREGK